MYEDNFINKNSGNFIKGIAIVLLLIHHFFAFPEWIISNIYPAYFSVLQYPTLICVPIFSFLTGYFYYYHKDKSFLYSLKKSFQLWIKYLMVFLPILFILLLLNKYDFTLKNFILDLFALQKSTMRFCYYLVYYFLLILLLWIYSKISEKVPIVFQVVLWFIPRIILFFIETKLHFVIKHEALKYLYFFPCNGY